jgi:hypothetical protein
MLNSQKLRALFHLTEELDSRDKLANLPETDYAHLVGDIQRVYSKLVSQWLDYMEYLNNITHTSSPCDGRSL